MNLIQQIEKDKEFGFDIMRAAGIKVVDLTSLNGLQVCVTAWFSQGHHVGPVFCYIGNEADVQLMWPYKIKEPRIFQSTLKKALPIIKKTGHSGHVTLRVLINSDDGKAYGIRWQTSPSRGIALATSKLIKVPMAEWMKWIEEGLEGDWALSEFHYMYSGSIIDAITEVNTKLLIFRTLGYELPLNLDAPKSLDGLVSDFPIYESDQFHQ